MRGDVIQPTKQNIFSPLCSMFKRWSRPTLRILSDFGPFLKLLRNFSRGIKKSQLKIQSLRMNKSQGGSLAFINTHTDDKIRNTECSHRMNGRQGGVGHSFRWPILAVSAAAAPQNTIYICFSPANMFPIHFDPLSLLLIFL